MCLIAFAIGASARWPLVIASNRDEFLNRPTLPLTLWKTSSGTDVISGRDLRAGGTWLGLTTGGRIAMLTNVRNPEPSTGKKSRGDLVMKWLEGQMNAVQFMAQTNSEAYGAFNLILGDFRTGVWNWLTNYLGSQHSSVNSKFESGWESSTLRPGIYGLSNSALDTPWPKTLGLKEALKNALASPDEDALQVALWRALQNSERAIDERLPSTGVPFLTEQALSSAFVDFPEHGYGTRCSTLLVATHPKVHIEIAKSCHVEKALSWDLQAKEITYPHLPSRLESGLQRHIAQQVFNECRLTWH